MCQCSFIVAPDHRDLIKNMTEDVSFVTVALCMDFADFDSAGYMHDRFDDAVIDAWSMLILVGWKKVIIENFSEDVSQEEERSGITFLAFDYYMDPQTEERSVITPSSLLQAMVASKRSCLLVHPYVALCMVPLDDATRQHSH